MRIDRRALLAELDQVSSSKDFGAEQLLDWVESQLSAGAATDEILASVNFWSQTGSWECDENKLQNCVETRIKTSEGATLESPELDAIKKEIELLKGREAKLKVEHRELVSLSTENKSMIQAINEVESQINSLVQAKQRLNQIGDATDV